jgi:hypothetical protein
MDIVQHNIRTTRKFRVPYEWGISCPDEWLISYISGRPWTMDYLDSERKVNLHLGANITTRRRIVKTVITIRISTPQCWKKVNGWRHASSLRRGLQIRSDKRLKGTWKLSGRGSRKELQSLSETKRPPLWSSGQSSWLRSGGPALPDFLKKRKTVVE